ncbi:uncharacterized protein LOC117563718 isoform X2 [Drosophila albomicans]|uniref:Uncharacterized protein LOC117563718 isoform X2 n=1 Tax=Drosophila albomicans TaxID=7291 RepID=A0A6P8XFJ6_DROAB|nr:uncharacterized protein LOC117563718 isoform X2 [Drosophila albomicans]
MLQRLLSKLRSKESKTSRSKQSGQQFEMGVLKKSQSCHKDGRLGKTRCNCEPTACKCSKKKQQQQQQQQRQQSLLLSQLRRRGADNLSSIILF